MHIFLILNNGGRILLYSQKTDLVIFFIMTGFMLFSVFKSGFVRHDGHVLIFLAVFALFLGFILVSLTNELKASKMKSFMTFNIILCLAMIGSFMTCICIIAPWVPQANVISNAPSTELSLCLMSNETLFDNLVTSQKESIKNTYPLEPTLSTESITSPSISFPGMSHCVGHTISTGLQGRCSSHTPHTPHTSIRLIVSIL